MGLLANVRKLDSPRLMWTSPSRLKNHGATSKPVYPRFVFTAVDLSK